MDEIVELARQLKNLIDLEKEAAGRTEKGRLLAIANTDAEKLLVWLAYVKVTA